MWNLHIWNDFEYICVSILFFPINMFDKIFHRNFFLSEMETGSDNDQGRPHCCFNEWLNLQHQDLSELLHAQTLSPDNPTDRAELSQLAQKNI